MATNDTNKVEYGLDKLTVFEVTEESGKITYGESHPLKGAVSLTADKEGDEYTKYADNTAYYRRVTDNGYSGSVSLTYLTEADRIFLFGDEKDSTGGLTENAMAPTKRFGMAFRCQGDAKGVIHQFLDVTFKRPSIEANTTEDSIDVGDLSMDYTATPVEVDDNHRISKRRYVEGDSGYAAALTSMALPQFDVGTH